MALQAKKRVRYHLCPLQGEYTADPLMSTEFVRDVDHMILLYD